MSTERADSDSGKASVGTGPTRRGVSIRIRLLGLVLVALVPTAAIGASIAHAWQAAGEDDVAEAVLRYAEAAAVHQENLMSSTALLLETLAETGDVTDRANCASTLRNLSRRLPQYGVIGVGDSAGSVWCSSQPTAEPVSVADRSYFVETRRSRAPAVGDYQIGRITGKPTVALAHPLFADDGRFAGAVIASIDLSRPALLAERLDLPEGTTVTVVDGTGTVLMRWPEVRAHVGRKVTEGLAELRPGSTDRLVGFDGVERIHGAADLSGDGSVVLTVGVPATHVNTAVSDALGDAAQWFAVVAIAAGGAALAIGHSSVARPIRQLRDMTRRLAAGDLTARVTVPAGGELRLLAEDLDTMADALEERAELEHRASHDPLTGLGNRDMLHDRLERLLTEGRTGGIAVVYVDLDRFKSVNDDLGHHVGDELLRWVADRLREVTRSTDVVARVGGDEFVVVGAAGDEDMATRMGERIASALAGPVEFDGATVVNSASVGITHLGPGEQADVSSVLVRADNAMYEAKRAQSSVPR